MTNKLPLKQRGLTLVELMIAMVLGLILLLGVSNVFLAQRRSFGLNENLAHMQDNTRAAFELMARDLREAGETPCGTTLVANVINGEDSSIWWDWNRGGIEGFDGDQDTSAVSTGTAEAERVTGTDAVIVRSGSTNSGVVVTKHTPASAQFQVNTVNHGFRDGDIVMVCDYHQAAIFQITNANSGSNTTIVHNTGSATPGNCSKGLGFPTDCSSTVGNSYSFENNGFITKLSSSIWYIGTNSRGGRSLFRIINDGTAQEIADGVTNMQLDYLTRTGATVSAFYVDAKDISSWATDATTQVIAARVRLTVQSAQAVGSNGTSSKPIERELIHVVSLRNREIVP